MSSTSESSEETFQCSICLKVLYEPVSTPCGHNFCKRCLCQTWNTDGPCTCPLCNRSYNTRPELSVNTLLCEVHLKSKLEKKKWRRSMEDKPVFKEVQCDVCSEPKLKARKSCLVCMCSFCVTHLQPHLTVSGLKTHQLMEPVGNLEDRMCLKHQHPLDFFCGTDEKIVCLMCFALEHKDHELVSLEEGCVRRRSSLLHTQAQSLHMLEQRRLKVEELKGSVGLWETEFHRERAEGLQDFIALIESVQRSQGQFLEELQEKQSLSHKRAEELVQQLEQEICELEKSSTEAERRCPAFMPPAGMKEWSSVSFETETCEGSVDRALAELDKTLSEKFNKAKLKRVKQFAVDITLDPDTAPPCLVLSEDLKQVYCGIGNFHQRFHECASVLGKQSFSSGRFYFEVQVKGKTSWALGVTIKSIERKRKVTECPKNGFWCIELRNKDEYKACPDSPVCLSVQQAPQKVGVFVDYGEGLVSFYDTDSADLLYSFTNCGFRETLFPYFSPNLNTGGSNNAPLRLTEVKAEPAH